MSETKYKLLRKTGNMRGISKQHTKPTGSLLERHAKGQNSASQAIKIDSAGACESTLAFKMGLPGQVTVIKASFSCFFFLFF